MEIYSYLHSLFISDEDDMQMKFITIRRDKPNYYAVQGSCNLKLKKMSRIPMLKFDSFIIQFGEF